MLSPLLRATISSVLRASRNRRLSSLGPALLVVGAGLGSGTASAELPTPCVAGVCGAAVNFVTSGHATAVVSGNDLTVNQSTSTAVLNWQSFNIGVGNSVEFKQPDQNSVAVNRIFQESPSSILGRLTANGQVYLLNQNGIVFGNGAQVNVGGLIASSLGLNDLVLANGLIGPIQQNQAAFTAGTIAGDVTVESGANLTARSGGRIFLLAPQVTNRGQISAPDGQVVLAGGESVYLFASSDEDLRGLLVEVGAGGTTTNAGVIRTDRGNTTLVGMAVNQEGRISANTSVRLNGSVRLLAREIVSGTGTVPSDYDYQSGVTTLSGTIETLPDLDSDERTIDKNEQRQSFVELQGRHVILEENSAILAPGGRVSLRAINDPFNEVDDAPPDDSRIYLAATSRIDVSGSIVDVPIENNLVEVELRADELRDSPLIRDSPLRSRAIVFDVRERGVRDDGTTWVGTPIADVSGAIEGIQRGVGERTTNGGTIQLESTGEVIARAGSQLSFAGGAVRYQDGYINTTRVLTANGRILDIADADRNQRYSGVASGYEYTYRPWGITESFATFGFDQRGRFEQGYVEGRDAGTLSIVSPRAVIDATLNGSAIVGPHQQRPSSELTAGQVRFWNEVPLGGELIIGGRSSSEVFAPSANLVVSESSVANLGPEFNPLSDVLPDELRDLIIVRPSMIEDGGVSRVGLFSRESVVLPEGETLVLAPGGSLAVESPFIDIAGTIRVPAGSVDLSATPLLGQTSVAGIEVRSTATIDVAGLWSNDHILSGATAPSPYAGLVDGGDVTISADLGPVTMAAGSRIDASAGAWVRSDGTVELGRGGDIELATSGNSLVAPALTLDGTLEAYGFQQGGSLSLTAPAICITAGAECREGSDSNDAPMLVLAGDFFSQNGFGEYTLTTFREGLVVTPGTQVLVEQQNLVLLAADTPRGTAPHLSTPTGANRSEFARIARLNDFEREAASISLRASIADDVPLTEANLARHGITIGAGSFIGVDAGGSIALQSNAAIVVAGTLAAPAGEIRLNLLATGTLAEFLDNQAIWLTDTARLYAPGVSRSIVTDEGLRTGEVLDAGIIALNAQRGYIVAAPDSILDVSGVSAVFDYRQLNGTRANVVATTVAGSAGRIDLAAAEGMLLAGTMTGHAATDSSVGGSLRITLEAGNRNEPASIPFPTSVRRLDLVENAAPIAVETLSNVPSQLNGIAVISAQDIEQSGFHDVTLKAVEIGWHEDVSLTMPRSIALDTQTLVGSAGALHLEADYVRVENSLQASNRTAPLNASSLAIDADLIDVVGAVRILGATSVAMASSGDLRLQGQMLGREVKGSLLVPSELTLAAAQIYPTTLTQFEITAGTGSTLGSIAIQQTGTTRDVLSAGGALTLRAGTIDVSGTLKAPFGTMHLIADEINLGADAVLSVSGDGLTVPFGLTQAGLDWIYPLGSQTLVFDGELNRLPERRISLEGDAVNLGTGSVIDLSGGGDLLAAEFVSGVQGTRDFLADPDAFAIVPALNLAYAPYDPYFSEGTTLRPGDSVYLHGGAGLPAGEYVKLPARYAALPGAYLVRPTAGYTGLRPGQQIESHNGSTIISGFNLVADSDVRDSLSGGFTVIPRDVLFQQSQYDVSSANEFFSQDARLAAGAAGRLPQDAGILQLTAATLELDGELRAATHTEGALGAAVDISADRIAVVGDNSAAPVAGVLTLRASDLSALGVDSLMIGGTRQTQGDDVLITSTASEVIVENGADLSGSEILLTATNDVTVRGGARVRASGDAIENEGIWEIGSNGSLLAVSTDSDVDVTRAANSVGGALTIENGATVSAAGGLAIDAGANVSLLGTLATTGGTLSIASDRIALGTPDSAPGALVLSADTLQRLEAAEFRLRSRDFIDVYGTVDLSGDRIELDAAGLRAAGTGDVLRASAREISLGNEHGATGSASGSTPAGGQLDLAATERVVLADGSFEITGFSTPRIDAPLITGEEASDVSFSGASNVDLRANVLTTAGGGRLALDAGDAALTVLRHSTDADVSTEDAGGEIALSARMIDVGTTIRSTAGTISLAATGGAPTDGVVLRDGAQLDVAGRDYVFDGKTIGLWGGRVLLTAAAGDITVGSGATISVAGGSNAAGGSVELSAQAGRIDLQGSLLGHGTASGGSARVDASSLSNLAAINQVLAAGGFTDELYFRQRVGDLAIGDGVSITAQRIDVVNDGGALDMSGALRSDGGAIGLYAAQDLVVRGSIDARSSEAGGGGSVLLSSTSGRLDLAGGAVVRVGDDTGANTGEVLLRADRAQWNSVIDTPTTPGITLAGTIEGAAAIKGEAFSIYDNLMAPDGSVTLDASVTGVGGVIHQEATAFMARAADIESAILAAGGHEVTIVPGVEIVSTGNMTVTDEWDLAGWRFANDRAGVLTLRAGGDLTFAASLTDGFAIDPNFGTPALMSGESWSYRLAAGADVTSAAPLSVRAGANALGDLIVNAGVEGTDDAEGTPMVVRTGTGDIQIAAARDVVLTNRASAIYTAGRALDGASFPSFGEPNGLGALAYPILGGDIEIFAGQDVRGALPVYSPSSWLWRQGDLGIGSEEMPTDTSWSVYFPRFEHNLGTLGGGDIRVRAGRDVSNLSAAAPTVGVPSEGGSSPVEILGGGDVSVRAARDVLGGVFLVERGTGEISAGASVGAPTNSNGTLGLAPTLLLADTTFNVTGGAGVRLEGAANTTLLPAINDQLVGVAPIFVGFGGQYFMTYAPDAGINLIAAAGDVVLSNNVNRLVNENFEAPRPSGYATLTHERRTLRLFPGTLRGAAVTGSLLVERPFDMAPSSLGDLQLFAAEDVTLAAGAQIFMSDADPAWLPSINNPADSAPGLEAMFARLLPNSSLVPVHAATPVHAGSEVGPVRIVARDGDIEFASAPGEAAATNRLVLPKAARVIAGNDIVNMTLYAQNVDEDDITLISAGRNIIYPLVRNESGKALASSHAITLDGPGRLEIYAGRDIELGTSQGISTRGDTINAALADQGANIGLLVGLGDGPIGLEAFSTRYLQESSEYDAALLGYVASIVGTAPGSKSEALATFASLSRDQQLPLIRDVFFAELRASGRHAAEGSNDYSRGFAAINALFPDLAPVNEGDDVDPSYTGNLSLFFSRLYSLDGGSIDILAPGGAVNVGLAATPSSLGFSKDPEQLGIVAQGVGDVRSFTLGDFLVNESRVFAADSGDILLWVANGDIDAGRGAKTAISAPPPTVTVDAQGNVQVTFPAALSGSGIRAFVTSEGREAGDVDLYAPFGAVIAGDAGIGSAGNVTIGAVDVIGADNIDVGGVGVGVSVDTGTLGAGVVGASSSSAAASQQGGDLGAQADAGDRESLAAAALSWLEVFVIGLGEDGCSPSDTDCLKRQELPN